MPAPAYQSSGWVAIGGSTSANVPRPTGTAAGDLIFVEVDANVGVAVTWSAPDASWTSIASTATGRTFYKIATGSEPATWTFTRTGLAGTNRAWSHRVSGAGSVVTAEMIARGAKTSFTFTSKSVPVADCLLLSFAIDHSGTGTGTPWASPGTVTEAYDAINGIIGWEVVQPSSTGTRLFTPAASTNVGPAQVLIAPPPTVTGSGSASGGGSASATGIRTVVGSAAGSGGGAAAGTGVRSVVGAAAASGGGDATASGDRTVVGSADATGGGDAEAAGQRTVLGSGTASGGGTAAAEGDITEVVIGSGSASGGGSASATGVRTVVGAADASGGGDADASGTRTVSGQAVASGGGDADATGQRTVLGSASASGGGTATASGHLDLPTPPERIFTTPAENRTFVTPAETRTFITPAENRTFTS